MNDLRFALRQLVLNPAFSAVAILSLALGIGANTTVFCWIQNVLWRPIPGTAHPEQLVALITAHGATRYDCVSRPDLKDNAQLKEVFAGVIGSQVTPACLRIDGQPRWAYGQIATANFFDVLGVKAMMGRTFLAEEDSAPSGHPVLVLSEGFWRRQFGGRTDIVGRSVELNRRSFTIVGVVSSRFHGTMSGLICDFWVPLSMHKEVANFGSWEQRSDHWLHTQARLQPGVSLAKAQAAVEGLGRQLEQAFPDTNREIRFQVLPLWQAPYGGQAVLLPVLQLLMIVSVGVLLIVAANVANLLLARATARQKEMAIRLSMGAGRGRLIRQLLTESLVLAAIGGALGILFSRWGSQAFRAFLPGTYLPVGYTFDLDASNLVYTMGVTLATGLLFGLAPALQSGRQNLSRSLREGGRTSGQSSGHHRLRGALVIGEVALALLLLTGAGLCLKGSQRARQVDMGFDPNQVMIAGLRIGMHGYDETRGMWFYRQLRQRLSELPGVEEAALASWLPLGFEGGPSLSVDADGYERRENEDLTVRYSIVSPGYLAALKIPILDGRDFTEQDDGRAKGAAIINETMAKRFWAGQNPVGRKFRVWGGQKELTVVGIVKAGKYRSLNEVPTPFFYLPYQQGVWDLNLGIAIRVKGKTSALAGAVRKVIRELDPEVEPWTPIMEMSELVQAAFFAQKITVSLLSALGLVALALAAMGIYGVLAYVVTMRTHEIGIRMALGAEVASVMLLTLRQGLGLALAGIGLGLIGSLGVTHLLSGFLFGVSPLDPFILLTVTAGLLLVATLACCQPAFRAARVDPLTALRCE